MGPHVQAAPSPLAEILPKPSRALCYDWDLRLRPSNLFKSGSPYKEWIPGGLYPASRVLAKKGLCPCFGGQNSSCGARAVATKSVTEQIAEYNFGLKKLLTKSQAQKYIAGDSPVLLARTFSVESFVDHTSYGFE